MAVEVIETQFADLRIPCAHDGKTIQVALEPLCLALGLDWEGENGKISDDDELGPLSTVVTDAQSGSSFSTLPLGALVLWFARLKEYNGGTELRHRLAILQQEGFAMLLAQWHAILGSPATGADGAKLTRQFNHLQLQILTLMDALKSDRSAIEREILRAQLGQLCTFRVGSAIRQSPILDRFWETLFSSMEHGIDLNHARRADKFLALNFNHLAHEFSEIQDSIQLTRELQLELKKSRHPPFLGVRVVNSRIARKSLRCWVFNLA